MCWAAATEIKQLLQQLAAMTTERDDYMRDYGKEQDRKREVAQQLAESQAREAQLRDVLEQLLDDMGAKGHCVCEASKQWATEVLAIPKDDTALREWGARLLEEIKGDDERGNRWDHLQTYADNLRSGEWKP
jgi:predicted  nucleic acid-binding Zn-ribbon protein